MLEISGCLVVREKKILMKYNSEMDAWNVPQGRRKEGELSSEAAKRITEDFTGCESEVSRYRQSLKTEFVMEGEEFIWQPYSLEIEGETDAEWVPVDELESRDLAPPLSIVKEDLMDKI